MTAIAAFLLVCATNADRDVASAVHAAAVHAGVDPAFALAVAAVESCATGPNPLGVRGCRANCVTLGAVSLANRLRGCQQNVVATHRRMCGGGSGQNGQPSLVRKIEVGSTPTHHTQACALRTYNGSANAAKYAAKVDRIARVLRRQR